MTCTRHLQILIVIFIVVCALEHSAKAGMPDSTECYIITDGADYRGSINTTTTGKTCQQWTSQIPHAHSRTPENYPDTGVDDHNFCRNPDGERNAWCYTTDPNMRWDFCDIGSQGEPCECYKMANGADYRGSMHTTADGQTCQRWTSQTPHVPSVTPENYPDTGLGDHNFCRNPGGESTAWCYTMDPDIQWNYCDIGSSEVSCECYEMTDGADYRGSTHTTTTGKTCQPWTSQTPHAHSRTPENYPDTGVDDHNFCRNPDGEPNAWCYTTDPNMRWDFCDIGSPGEPCGSQPNSEVMLVGGSNNNDGSVAGSGECYEETNGADYRGSISITNTGETCAKWTYFGNYYINSYPDAGLGDHNFCRNYDGSSTVWCYLAFGDSSSSSSSVSWGDCDIGSPGEHCSSQSNSEVMLVGGSNNNDGSVAGSGGSQSNSEVMLVGGSNNNDGSVAGSGECYENIDGSDYRGSIHTTTTGVTCQKWNAMWMNTYPNKGLGDHNFCRNPDRDAGGAWCFYTTANHGTNWTYCDIGNPGEHCSAVQK